MNQNAPHPTRTALAEPHIDAPSARASGLATTARPRNDWLRATVMMLASGTFVISTYAACGNVESKDAPPKHAAVEAVSPVDDKGKSDEGAAQHDVSGVEERALEAASARGQVDEASLKEKPTKETKTTAASEVASEPPSVKRLVVAEQIENREPVKMTAATVGDPVTAFVELKNPGDESKIVITFEHESGTKVGFIELSVPAQMSRYRTWGRTQNIKKAGKWTAVVATESGEELSREDFEVAPVAGAIPEKPGAIPEKPSETAQGPSATALSADGADC